MKHVPIRTGPSLLERAAEIYDFGSGALIAPAFPPEPEPKPEPAPVPVADVAPEPRPEPVVAPEQPLPLREAPVPAPRRAPVSGRSAAIDRARLRQRGFILPESGSSTLAEELRLVKRQLLRGVAGGTGIGADKRRTVLVCSAQPGEGKTFCALNLALSLAAESEVEVLLVDCDVAKPEALALLGIEDGPGLIDALADPALDPESCVIRTDVDGLSVLPAGRQANNVPELLASARTGQILAGLAAADPRRIILIDSPPVLMASPAGILAGHVGQVLIVVRADRTSESDLKEAVGLLSACDHVGLVLNGAGFAASGRRFGQYEETQS